VTVRQHLLIIRSELDELMNVVRMQDTTEHELIMARASRVYKTITEALVELDETELKGYDC